MMKKYFIVLALCFLAVVPAVYAADEGPTKTTINVKIDNPFNCGGASDCNIVKLFEIIVNKALLPIGGALAVLAFIWSGFMFVTAQGNPGDIAKAKTALLYTAIGTALLLGAVALTKVITGTINALK